MELRRKLSKIQSSLPAVVMVQHEWGPVINPAMFTTTFTFLPGSLLISWEVTTNTATNLFLAHELQVIMITHLLGQSNACKLFSVTEFL